jgi:hypothetical protein
MTFQRYISPPIDATGLRMESVAEIRGAGEIMLSLPKNI